MITYSNEGVSMPKIKRRAITAWIKAVAASYNRKVGEVGYLFCNDEKILEVNQQYLGHDYYTDIITFDYDEDDTICVQCKSQGLYGNMYNVSVVTGQPLEKLRMIMNPTGASFGWSMWPGDYALCVMATMATGTGLLHLKGKRCSSYLRLISLTKVSIILKGKI